MTALTTEARTDLIAAVDNLGYRVYDVAPAVPAPPCIVVIPDQPWINVDRIGSNLSYECRWRLLVVVSPRKNSAAQVDAEDAVDAVLGALSSPFLVTTVGSPQLTDTGAQGTVITTEISVSVRMKAS